MNQAMEPDLTRIFHNDSIMREVYQCCRVHDSQSPPRVPPVFACDLRSGRQHGLDLAGNIGRADKRVYCDITGLLIAHVHT